MQTKRKITLDWLYFFIAIPAEYHLDKLFVSNERLFNVDEQYWRSQE